MQPQDVYNRAYDAATADLEAWVATIYDVASIERERTAAYWRVRIRPYESNTCPAELMVSRAQTFDLDVGNESVVGQPVGDFKLFKPLLGAIADGDVVCRIWSAQATGAELAREVVVSLPDGHAWSMRRLISAGTAATDLSALAVDRAFVPYRR